MSNTWQQIKFTYRVYLIHLIAFDVTRHKTVIPNFLYALIIIKTLAIILFHIQSVPYYCI
jgi:hypothetical protein